MEADKAISLIKPPDHVTREEDSTPPVTDDGLWIELEQTVGEGVNEIYAEHEGSWIRIQKEVYDDFSV